MDRANEYIGRTARTQCRTSLTCLDLDRDGPASITQQLVDHFVEAIEAGKLEPGEKLPTTRALAADAGVNHLTAARVYRRLAELGYVTATVGRGTFVRTLVPAASEEKGDDWQVWAMPDRPLDLLRAGPGRRLPAGARARHHLALDGLAVAAALPDRGDRADHGRRVPRGGRRRPLLPHRRGPLPAARADRQEVAVRDRPRGDHRHLGRAPGDRPRLPRAARARRRGGRRVAHLHGHCSRRCGPRARA